MKRLGAGMGRSVSGAGWHNEMEILSFFIEILFVLDFIDRNDQ